MRYLPEHAEVASLTLELVEREAEHLAYTHSRIFAQPISLDWVERLAQEPEDAERVDAFVARFSRLQDTLGEKLIPRFAALFGENPKTLLDTLSYAERLGWVESAEKFIAARRLRNRLVHEYMTDPGLFREAMVEADTATQELLAIVKRMRNQFNQLGIKP